MDMIIDQQVALDEALVPHASRLRIGKSNFRLKSDISSKESTLQLVYDVMRLTPFFKVFLVTADVPEIYMQEFRALYKVQDGQQETYCQSGVLQGNVAYLSKTPWLNIKMHNYQVEHKDAYKNNEMYYLRFTKVIIHYFMSNDPSIPRRNKVNWHYVKDDQMFTTIKLEYYTVATGATPPKTKATVQKTKSSSDTIVTPPSTAATGTRLSTSTKGKQPTKASKAKNEGTCSIPGVLDVPTEESDEEISWKSSDEGDDDEGSDDQDDVDAHDDDDQDDKNKDDDDQDKGDDDDDQEEGSDDEKDSDEEGKEFIHPSLSIHDEEETRDEERFDPVPKMPKNMDDNGNGEENLGLNIGREEGQDEEDDEDELYRDVNINLDGRVVQLGDVHTTQEFEDSHTVNEQLEAEVLTRSSISSKTSYVVTADLSEMELKKILIEKIKGNKSIHRSNEQRNLYKALVEAYESDKIILDTYGDTVTLKRRRDDDANKDLDQTEGPRDEEKEMSQSQQALQKRKLPGALKPPTPDRDWNKTLSATHGSIQPWISELAKQTDSRSSFNELMDTHVDFLAFLMNRLKVDTLTPELLAGPTYELMKGLCKSLIQEPVGYDKHALWGISYWGRKRQQLYRFAVNKESARDVYSKCRIIAVIELKIVEWHNYKHLDWITVRRDGDKLYKFKEGDFKRLRIQDIEDMLLLLNVYKKHRNPKACGRPSTRCRKLPEEAQPHKAGYVPFRSKAQEAYTAYSNPRGFIYQDKDKQNRLMWIDELHKFSDGTLTDVRTVLDDHLKGIRMKYLPQTL
uniref:Uncharacterized protein n=1 Tax=Tanacetum cinerariifolium TaxID=118510 RepID=A0A699IAL6_TANCI|nr:hypothetical protein [Tanacetum cinerariifolium]